MVRDGDAFSFVRWRGAAAHATGFSREELAAASEGVREVIAEVSRPGDRVVVAHPPGPEFLIAMLACLRSGRIAVPALPPTTERAERALTAICSACAPTLALARRSEEHRMRGLRVLDVSEMPMADRTTPSQDLWPLGPTTTPAYLQFTSGSTRAPRGAIITFGALEANLQAIRSAWGLNGEDRGAFWLPPHHDMGLVGALLAPLRFGFPVATMHPAAFLQRPMRWLQLISETGATISGAPNFAYALCADRFDREDMETLDLRRWRVAINGAEPVSQETMSLFARKFGAAGFRAESFAPGYGLAESVLFVTGHTAGQPVKIAPPREREHGHLEGGSAEGDKPPRAYPSCGRPARGSSIAIVDGERALEDGLVGEIWLSGPSIADGYWDDARTQSPAERALWSPSPEAPVDPFSARLVGDPRVWLRTGDLGFMQQGELFVVGRQRDFIIRNGRKAHAADIEHEIARNLPAPSHHRCAVFSVRDPAKPSEELIALIECAADASHDVVRRAALDAFGAFELQPDRIVLAPPGAVRVTANGKIARAETRDAYALRSIPIDAEFSPPTATFQET